MEATQKQLNSVDAVQKANNQSAQSILDKMASIEKKLARINSIIQRIDQAVKFA